MRQSLSKLSCLYAIMTLALCYYPEWAEVYQSSWPVDVPIVYANGLYYMNNEYYNATNKTVTQVPYQANCSSSATFNTNFTIWCVAKSDDPENYTFSLNLMDIYLSNVTKSFTIPGVYNDTPLVYWFYSYQYVIIVMYDLDPYQYNISVFDTDAEEFVCQDLKLPVVKDTIQSVWFTGTDLVTIFLNEQKESDFLNIKCSSSRVIRTKGPSELQQLDFYGFNQSQIYLNYYVYEINGATANEVQVCDLNTIGTFSFGERMNVTTFSQLNDTHFLVSHYPKGIFSIDIFVITPEMKFLKVFSHQPNILAYELYIYPLIGTSQVSIYLKSGTLIYDFELDQIVWAYGINPPLFFSNGSIVNVTNYGYIIRNPGEPFYFINAPFGNTYQSPSDAGLVYSLYLPIYQNNVYNDCYFISIDAEANNITQILLPNCPGSTITIPTIKDVSYSEDGTPHILYRDALNMVYIVTPHSAKGPFKFSALLTFPAISQNVTTGVGYFVGVQVTQSQFTIGSFNLSNGTVLSTKTVIGGTFNYVYKMNSRYFMVASANPNNSTNFTVYDAWEATVVSYMRTAFKMSLQLMLPITAMGTTYNTSSYNGIIYTQFPCCLFLISADGNYTMLQIPVQHSYLDLQIKDSFSFFTYVSSLNMYKQTLIEVRAWQPEESLELNDM